MSVQLHLNPTGNPLLRVRPRASTFVRYLQAVQTSLVCTGELWLAVLNSVKCLLRDDLQSPSKLQVDGRQRLTRKVTLEQTSCTCHTRTEGKSRDATVPKART